MMSLNHRVYFASGCLLGFLLLQLVASPVQGYSKYERVVTNPNAAITGVEVDYSYNETASFFEFTSAPGCPKSVSGYPWVRYGIPPRCYLAGTRGPCDSDQKIFIERGNPIGYCNCDCFERKKRIGNRDDVQYCRSKFGLKQAFLPGFRKCFTLYEQGPCRSGEWLVLDNSDDSSMVSVRCEKRACPDGQEPKVVASGTTKCYSPVKLSQFSAPEPAPPRNRCKDHDTEWNEALKSCVKIYSFEF